jgi:hypothetical protein
MKTTTVSPATGRRDLAGCTAQLVGTLAANATLPLVGLGLTGFGWQAVSPVAVDSRRGRPHVVCNR